MAARAALKDFGLDEIYGIDYETYYAKDYSLRLKKYPTTVYVTDPQFLTQAVAVQASRWTKPRVMLPHQFKTWSKTVNWKRCGMLAHHTHFDGLIASYHDDIHPVMYFDTLSMARPVMPIQVRLGLDPLAKAFGFEGKIRGKALDDVKGCRELTYEQLGNLKLYAGDDIADTWRIFDKLYPFLPLDELRIIDLTIRMYTEPTVVLDFDIIEAAMRDSIEAKQLMLKKLKTTVTALGSADQFAEMLRTAGREPPTKVNKNGEVRYAFAKGDVAFKLMLGDPKRKVRDLVAARFAVKSAIIERRCQRMLDRRHLPAQPVYLNYCGARATLRWSGGDAVNWQNWPKRDAFKRPVKLRTAMRAPRGYRFIIADQRQIEARLASWQAGNDRVVKLFASGADVYRATAARIYSIVTELISDEQRFVGKTTDLSCFYGVGWARFARSLRAGTGGPEVDISDKDAQHAVKTWRQDNAPIVRYWKILEGRFKDAIRGGTAAAGPVTMEGVGKNVFIHLPNGTSLRYDDVQIDDEGKISYLRKMSRDRKGNLIETRTKLWGGHIFENITQALARALLGRQLVILQDAMPNIRIAASTHDEVLIVAPDRSAPKALREVMKAMRNVPSWAKGLPLDVEAKISDFYDKK